jgi:hypothetical protein
MELLIGLLIIAGIGYVVYRNIDKKIEEKHPVEPTAPYKVEAPLTTKADGIGHESVPIQPTISNVLDVNKDGKVNIEDAKEAVKKTTKKVKKVAAEVSEKVKKPKKNKTT